ncbi:MAG: phosphotransferase [Kineosporiaceae bacterium]
MSSVPIEGFTTPARTAEGDPASADVARLRAVPVFAAGPLDVVAVTGGLTNRNLKVTTVDGRRYVARLSSPDASLLAVDRDAEYHDSLVAALTGIAPDVVGRVVDGPERSGVLVLAWLDARAWTPDDVRADANLPRVAAACRVLHGGPRFARDFDMFAVQRRYLLLVRERGFRLPARYEDFLPAVDRIRAALAVRPEPTVPCNNDLLAANVLDDGVRLWLIDYEYAGNNDPCFELGNIWSESALEVGQLDLLVSAYYGRPLRNKIARARLLGLMSKYGWTLWASIQDGLSTIDFDFWSWGMEKYERAVAEFDGPDLPRLLDEVIRDD